jgi:membrane protein YqaA with SNARE-associated domain
VDEPAPQESQPSDTVSPASAEAQPESRIEASRLPAGGLIGAILYPFRLVKVFYAWVLRLGQTRYGLPVLAVVGFLDAGFIPIAPDPLLWALCFGRRRRSHFYAAVLIGSSICGAVTSWLVGHYFFDDIVVSVIDAFGANEKWFGTEQSASALSAAEVAALPQAGDTVFYPDGWFFKARESFEENALLAYSAAALTPLPDNIFMMAGGVFGVSLPLLMLGSALGRTIRFGISSTLIFFFGARVKPVIERYFEWICAGALVVLVGVILLLKYVV